MTRRLHRTVCLDLPDSLLPHVLAAIEESRRTFIVCTQDLASLHLARKKVQRLQQLGLDQLSVIINRHDGRSSLNSKHIEEVVGAGVEFVFSNDYKALTSALTSDRGMTPGSRLGHEFREFATKLATRAIGVKPKNAKRGFVEYFWLPQGPAWSFLSSRRS